MEGNHAEAQLLVVVAAATVALTAPATSSAAVNAFLKLDGVGETSPGSPGGCIDCSPPMMDFTGIATCEVCAPGKPANGTVRITTAVRTAAKNPCKVKSVRGTVEIAWEGGSISRGELTGRFRDAKALKLAGSFLPTDPIYPTDPTKVLLNNFPPSPCVASTGATTGTMAITMR
jgi:hypothetical protein